MSLAREDIATPERLQKPDIIIEDGREGGIEVRSYGWPIDTYLRRGLISPLQHCAGDKYAELYNIAYSRSRYTQVRYSDERGEYDPTFALECEQLFHEASMAVPEIASRKLLFSCCIEGTYAGRGNLDALRYALTDLCKHFKFYR